MAQGRGDPRDVEQGAELSFCLFPHLKEYVVIDTRRELPNGPVVHAFSADEVFDEGFYQELVDEFARLLRQRDQPFATLMALSANVEQLMREHGMQAMLQALNARAPVGRPPQIAIVLFAGPLLHADERQVRGVLRRLFPGGAPEAVLDQATQQLIALLAQEREAGLRQQREQTQRGLLGGQDEFLTIWQRPPEEGAG